MALGFLVGCVVRVLQLEQEEALLNFRGSFFFYVLLPPIIFEAGLSLKTQLFVDNLGSIMAFAVVGTLVSTWVVSASMRWATETQLIGLRDTPLLPIYCHLFGALISATDPVATIALFGSSRFRTDPLLHSLINGESVLNDAVAIVLFSTLTHHLHEEEPRLISASILGHFGLVLVGSVLVGVAAGAMLSWCFCTCKDLTRFPDYEIAGMFLGAYLTFALTQLISLSGITALFCFGVVLAHYNWYNLSEQSKVASKVIFGTMAKLAEAGVFVYLGVVAALSIGRFHWHAGCVIFALIAITVARAAHVFPLSTLLNSCRRSRKITNNMSVVMWVSGLRGAIAFALSLRVPCEGQQKLRGSEACRNSDTLVTTTISVVVVTTMVVGAAMEKIATALAVIEPVDHSQDRLESLSEPLASGLQSECQEEAQSKEDTVGARQTSSGRLWAQSIWTLPSLRFHSRGHLYQAFARWDLEVLQPNFGGPCHARGKHPERRRETFEMPKYEVEEEDAPLQSHFSAAQAPASSRGPEGPRAALVRHFGDPAHFLDQALARSRVRRLFHYGIDP
ncbi:unnamed protein product [Effrenium voratum]|nr:unnamed protein product [Effrenium voratum]